MKIVLKHEFNKYSLSVYYIINIILLGIEKLLLVVNMRDSLQLDLHISGDKGRCVHTYIYSYGYKLITVIEKEDQRRNWCVGRRGDFSFMYEDNKGCLAEIMMIVSIYERETT